MSAYCALLTPQWKQSLRQGCQMKISIKSQTVLKKARKRPNRLFKSQKKAKLYLQYCHSTVTKKHLNYKNIKKFSKFLKINSCLALCWRLELIITDILWFFMVYEIAQFGCNSATACILIHRPLSAPIWKSSPNNFSLYTYDQNHCSPSTSWRR